METPVDRSDRRLYLPQIWRVIGVLVLVAFGLAGLAVVSEADGALVGAMLVTASVAFLCVGVVLTAFVGLVQRPDDRPYFVASILGALITGVISAGAGLLTLIVAAGPMISPWGRPLRIRGKAVHPELRPGGEWAAGDAPACDDLSPATREALAILWHHDAQKEHASVPAFSRLAWLLAGLGAPAELLAETHRAGIQEIDHARRCFALAAGYAGAPLTVEPIPEILGAPLGVGRDPLRAVALESLRDGCLIEDFNADVAAVAAASASDPAAKGLAGIIARDEREHAALAWQILEWCLAVGDEGLRRAVAKAADQLPRQGPQAYADDEAALVAGADAEAMIAHGRLPAERWAAIYAARRALTCARVEALLGATASPAIAAA